MAHWNGRRDGLKVVHNGCRYVHEAFGSSIVWIPGTSAIGSNGILVFASSNICHLKVSFVSRLKSCSPTYTAAVACDVQRG